MIRGEEDRPPPDPERPPGEPRPRQTERAPTDPSGTSAPPPMPEEAVSRLATPRRGLGFPKALRVLLRSEFDAVRREGHTVRNGVLRIRYLARPGQPTRLGLAVSRRAGNAVRRNRIKRIVREAFRQAWDALPPGLDLVVSPADPRRASRLDEVQRSLSLLVEQAASGRRPSRSHRRRKRAR